MATTEILTRPEQLQEKFDEIIRGFEGLKEHLAIHEEKDDLRYARRTNRAGVTKSETATFDAVKVTALISDWDEICDHLSQFILTDVKPIIKARKVLDAS